MDSTLRSRRAALEIAAAAALGAAARPAIAATPLDELELERGRVEPDWGRGRVEIVVERRKKLDGSPGSNAALTALSFFGLFALGGSFGVGQKRE